MKQKKVQKQEGLSSSDRSNTSIVKLSKLFVILCTVSVCLIAIVFWGIKSFSPYVSESTSGLKEMLIANVASRQKAVDLLKKEMLGLADELVGEFPANERVRILAVEMHLNCANFTQAKVLLEEGIRLNPMYGDFYQKMARDAFHHEEYDKAIIFWKKTLEVSPERLNLNVDIADALIILGKYREAIEILQKNIKISQGSARVFYLLGQCHLQLKEYNESKKYFEKAIAIRPDKPDAHYGLSKVYIRLKQPDKAKAYLKMVKEWKANDLRNRNKFSERDSFLVHDLTTPDELEIFPELFVKLCMEGNNLYAKNKNLDKISKIFKKGETTFSQAVKFAPQAPGIYREFAFFYILVNKKPAETIELAKRAVELDGSAKNYFILNVALYKNSDLFGALKALRKALELDPGNLMYKQAFDRMNRNK